MERLGIWSNTLPQTVIRSMPDVGIVEIIPPIYLGQRVQINIPTEGGTVPCPHFSWACHYRDLSLLVAVDTQTGRSRQFACSSINCELAEFTS